MLDGVIARVLKLSQARAYRVLDGVIARVLKLIVKQGLTGCYAQRGSY